MKKLTPIDVDGDGARIHDSLSKMLIRVAKHKGLDTSCGLGAVAIIVALEKYFNEEWTVEQACERIDGSFTIR